MKCKAIVSEFCERNGIECGSGGRDGAVTLRLGDSTVLIVPDDESETLNVLSAIGEPSAGDTLVLERRMLEETLRLAENGGAYLSFDAESGAYVAVETVSADGLDADALQDIVTEVVALKDEWKNRLDASCPAAAECSSADGGVMWA